jgi:lipopolysaccharide transport system permease protein
MKKNEYVSIVYTSESRIRNPLLLLKEMWLDLKASRELAWRLMIRDISALYRQTMLGYFWAVFPPLVTSFVLILMNRAAVINVKDLNVPYPVYVMMGTVFFQLFVDALNAPLKTVREAKNVLLKINLPKESLIISGMGQVLFSFFIKLIMLIGVMIYFKASIQWTAVFVIFPLVGLLLLGTMVGIILIPLGLLYKDIQSALLVATSGLLFLTPVAYPPSTGGFLGSIIKVNPITPLLMGARELVFKGLPANMLPFFVVFVVTVGLLLIGWIIYRLSLPIIVERLGA